MGLAYFRLEQYDQAVPYFRKAIDAGPVKASYYVSLGETYRELKEYDKAEVWFLRALAVEDSAIARLALGLTYLEQNLVAVGESVHKEGIRLKPGDPERLEAYADFLSNLGREEEA